MTDVAAKEPSTPIAEEQSIRQMAQLLEHLREGCIFVGYDMRVRFMNASARGDLGSRGIEEDQYRDRIIWDLLQYDAEMPSRTAVEQAARDHLPAYFTTRGSSGTYWVETDVVPVEQGILLHYRDATPRSNAELARSATESELRMTNQRLRVFLDDAPLAILMMDTVQCVLHWNPAAEAMFLWRQEEVLGQPLPTVPEDERAAFLKSAQRVNAGETLRAFSCHRVRKDGVRLDCQVSASPMRDREGRVTGAIIMITDVTSHRRLESQLRMAQKMEAVGLLAGGVAHDFNNLLTAIKGFASLLEMTLPQEDQSVEFLGEINRAADRAAALTAQLLAFSRRQLLRPEPIDLNARVRELERMLDVLLRGDAQLVLDLDPSLSRVLADPGQVEQVIINLVLNARDAVRGRAGARVTVTTRNAELEDEFSQWEVQEAPGHYVRLDVRDNGTGMDRATLARIFDPFFTTKEPGQGTGLGLATVFGIVKQSDGYIWASSVLGEGTVLTVYLPRAKHAGRESGAVAIEGGRGSESILLVDDDPAIRRVARRALELHGYTVFEAANGSSALAIGASTPVDILVTDVMMPGMLGPQLASELRRQAPGLPVLFTSGHTDEIVRDGLLDPATPFLAKPFTPSQLAHKVREALDRSERGQRASDNHL